MDYDSFKSSEITCRHCGWQGVGTDMEVGESFEGGQHTEYHCPNCGEYWGAVPWPTIEQE